MKHFIISYNKYYIFFLLLLFSGCTSIPSEAPTLSQELGSRLSAIEDSHIRLIHKFFDQKRSLVDNFIINEYTPIFARNIFDEDYIAKSWETIVRENNKKDRLNFILILGPRLQKKINLKRIELIKPLDNLERTIEQHIRNEYAQAKAINNAITSLLLSAAKVNKNRDRYLGMIGITDQKIGKVIDNVDLAVSKLISQANVVEQGAQDTEIYIKTIQDLIDNI